MKAARPVRRGADGKVPVMVTRRLPTLLDIGSHRCRGSGAMVWHWSKIGRPTDLGARRAEMKQRFSKWLADEAGEMIEGALTLPIMALVSLALVNFALAGYASVTANNAVNYAARVASVSQQNVTGEALNAANRALSAGIGDYQVDIQADAHPGGTVRVSVRWEVPNFFGSLMPLFGAANRPLQGEAVSVFRKEGW